MATKSAFNPATMAMEAHCEECGALVATMTREAQDLARDLGASWFALLLAGTQNHRGACRGNGVE